MLGAARHSGGAAGENWLCTVGCIANLLREDINAVEAARQFSRIDDDQDLGLNAQGVTQSCLYDLRHASGALQTDSRISPPLWHQ